MKVVSTTPAAICSYTPCASNITSNFWRSSGARWQTKRDFQASLLVAVSYSGVGASKSKFMKRVALDGWYSTCEAHATNTTLAPCCRSIHSLADSANCCEEELANFMVSLWYTKNRVIGSNMLEMGAITQSVKFIS